MSHKKARIVLLVQDMPRPNMILSMLKYQTYKEYPRDLHLREHIIALRMIPEGRHDQVWDEDKHWMHYTL